MAKRRFGAGLKLTALCLAIGCMTPAISYGAGPAAQTEGSWNLGTDGQWYYYGADGVMRTGWIEISGKYYYLYEDGHCAMGEVTPDGYRVDENGVWYEVKKDILGVTFSVPARFVPAGSPGEAWTASKDPLLTLNEKLETAFLKARRLTVGNEGVEYRSWPTENAKSKSAGTAKSGAAGTRYMGLYKDYETNGYRLDLGVTLEPGSTDENRAATYDYAVFTALLSSVSSAPDELAAAVVSSWQEENVWGISRTAYVAVGDCEVKFAAGDGYGKYFIRPRS